MVTQIKIRIMKWQIRLLQYRRPHKKFKMGQASGSTLKKISKRSLIKPPTRDRFEDLVEGEFYNGAFKKNLLIFHECPTRKGAFPVITG